MTSKPDPLLAHCRALPGVTEDVKWGDNLVFSVGGKMFAVFQADELVPFGCKVDPLLFSSLVGQDEIEPAPYLARHHWISIKSRSALPLEMVRDMLSDAHRLVAAKLPKKKQRELGLDPG